MARLKDIPPFLGTRDGICVYTRWGKYYVRTKSSLSGKRVKSAPEFKKTREYASFLSRASILASGIYRKLEVKNVRLYRHLTGEAMKLLKEGMKEELVIERLLRPYSLGEPGTLDCGERPESETQVIRKKSQARAVVKASGQSFWAMAGFNDNLPFLGTRNGICFYTRCGNYYVRTKSSLSGKRVRSAPEFKKTREYASFLSRASILASGIYRKLEIKNVRLYRHLTGEAMKLLKEGMKEELVIERLLRPYSKKSLNSQTEINSGPSQSFTARSCSPESQPARRHESPPLWQTRSGGYP